MRLPEGTQSASLWGRLNETLGLSTSDEIKPENLHEVPLDKHEVAVLLGFARDFMDVSASARDYPWQQSAMPFRVTNRAVVQALHEVLVAPIDLQTERGRALEQARLELGLRSRTDAIVLLGLLERYGPNHLRDVGTIYKGHTTAASISVLPLVRALGATVLAYGGSTHSGDAGVASLFNTMLSRMSSAGGKLARHDDYVEHLRRCPNPTVVINGGRIVAQGLPEDVLQRIARGEIRFVMHNAADEAALRKLPVPAVILDIAHSVPKELEGRVIGEQLAVHASDVCYRAHGVRLRDSKLALMGCGLIGRNVLRGLSAFGFDPDRVIVIDPDANARDVARSMGIKNVHDAIPDTFANEPHAVLIEATNGMSVDGSIVDKLPRHCAIMTASSDGVGIDIESLRRQYIDQKQNSFRFGAFNGAPLDDRNVFSQLILTRGQRRLVIGNTREDSDGTRRAYAVNLIDPVGQQRLVTSPMLAIAVCELATVNSPGIHAVSDHGTNLLQTALGSLRGGALIRPLIPARLHPAVESLASFGPQPRLYEM